MTAAITIRDLGKRYRLGAAPTLHAGLFARMRRMAGKSRDNTAAAKAHPSHVWALREVNLDVPPGQVLGVVGANGAGKSTLLKLLSRITTPTTGEFRIRGRVASLLEVGTGFHHDLTGRENVFLNGSILGMSRAEIARKFDEIVSFAEIEDFIDTPVKRYSTGMYTRLAFAVAAHLEPDILIVDEVLSVGDASFQRKCMGKMGDAAAGGRTVLFVSHNMSAVQRLCSRAILMHQGRLSADGDPSDIVEQYLALGAGPGSADGEDLASRPRVLETLAQRVVIRRCRILDSAGNPARTLRYGEPFTVQTQIEARGRCEALSLLVGVNSTDETRITNDASEDAGRFFDAAPDRPLTIDARFTGLTLVPGHYTVTIGVRSGGRGVDKLDRLAGFEVTPVCYRGVAPPMTGAPGYLRASPAWSAVDAAIDARPAAAPRSTEAPTTP